MPSTGIGSYVGLAKEVTYGTGVTPTTFLPVTSSSMKLEQTDLDSYSLRAGQLGLSEGQSTPTTRSSSGSLELNVQTKGMGKLLDLLNGDVNAPTIPGGATLARLFEFDIGLSTPLGKSLTYQQVAPDVTGVNRAFTTSGVKVAGATFSMDSGGVAASAFTLDGSDEVTATAAATATYATGSSEFAFIGASVELDDAVVLDCIRSVSVEISLPMATDRFCLGSSGVKREPLVNDWVTVTATAEAEFASLTQYAAFRAATRRKLAIKCVGAEIETGQNFEFNIVLPTTRTMAMAPELSGPDILTQSLEFKALQLNAASPLATIEFKSSDTAL